MTGRASSDAGGATLTASSSACSRLSVPSTLAPVTTGGKRRLASGMNRLKIISVVYSFVNRTGTDDAHVTCFSPTVGGDRHMIALLSDQIMTTLISCCDLLTVTVPAGCDLRTVALRDHRTDTLLRDHRTDTLLGVCDLRS